MAVANDHPVQSCEAERHIEKLLTVFWSIPVNLFEKLWACASGVSFTRTNHVSHSVHDFSEDPISKTTLVKVHMPASCIHPDVFEPLSSAFIACCSKNSHLLLEKTVPIYWKMFCSFRLLLFKSAFFQCWLLLSTWVLFHSLLLYSSALLCYCGKVQR